MKLVGQPFVQPFYAIGCGRMATGSVQWMTLTDKYLEALNISAVQITKNSIATIVYESAHELSPNLGQVTNGLLSSNLARQATFEDTRRHSKARSV